MHKYKNVCQNKSFQKVVSQEHLQLQLEMSKIFLTQGNARSFLHHVGSGIWDDIDRSGFGFLWTGLKPRCSGKTTDWNRSTLSGQGIVSSVRFVHTVPVTATERTKSSVFFHCRCRHSVNTTTCCHDTHFFHCHCRHEWVLNQPVTATVTAII